MTNRSDDTSDVIPRLGETGYGDTISGALSDVESSYTDDTSTAAPGTEAKTVQPAPIDPDPAHSLMHRVLDVLAQPGNRPLIETLTFEMRGDGTYFLSLETKK